LKRNPMPEGIVARTLGALLVVGAVLLLAVIL
jgi:hypothetical protein